MLHSCAVRWFLSLGSQALLSQPELIVGSSSIVRVRERFRRRSTNSRLNVEDHCWENWVYLTPSNCSMAYSPRSQSTIQSAMTTFALRIWILTMKLDANCTPYLSQTTHNHVTDIQTFTPSKSKVLEVGASAFWERRSAEKLLSRLSFHKFQISKFQIPKDNKRFTTKQIQTPHSTYSIKNKNPQSNTPTPLSQ